MNSKLGVGARINLFDNSPGMVYDFDKLFPECPLPERFSRDDQVVIGHYAGANKREIIIDGELIIHKMFNDLIYNIDRDDFREDETDKELFEINGTET
jgi:hypothetical protein